MSAAVSGGHRIAFVGKRRQHVDSCPDPRATFSNFCLPPPQGLNSARDNTGLPVTYISDHETTRPCRHTWASRSGPQQRTPPAMKVTEGVVADALLWSVPTCMCIGTESAPVEFLGVGLAVTHPVAPVPPILSKAHRVRLAAKVYVWWRRTLKAGQSSIGGAGCASTSTSHPVDIVRPYDPNRRPPSPMQELTRSERADE